MPQILEVPDNVLRNSLLLDLTIDEAVYVRGALRLALKGMRMGDQYEYVKRVLDRLNDAYLDISSYNNKPF